MIVAKIESMRALNHLDELVEATDAVMVARGDLGVEVPIEQLAYWQKTIILKEKISTTTKFCRNCGNNSFIVEKINKINFIDINYAIVIKTIFNNKKASFTQSWVDATGNYPPRLLTDKKL